MIFARETYNTENLKEEDFIKGIGFDLSLFNRFLESKNIKRKVESYYHENGTSIDGTIRTKKFHPLLNKIIIDNRTGEKGIIESIHRHWYFGEYWTLLFRKEGTRSHGSLIYKNINSISKITIDSIEETEVPYHRTLKFSRNFMRYFTYTLL